MCVRHVHVVAVGGFSHHRGFSQIKDLDDEILDYATERHIRGSFLPSFESSSMFGQCQQALISPIKKVLKQHRKTPSVLSILTISGQIKVGSVVAILNTLSCIFGFEW